MKILMYCLIIFFLLSAGCDGYKKDAIASYYGVNRITASPSVSEFSDVVIYTTVLDNFGSPVAGLTKDDFAIWEGSSIDNDLIKQTITSFKFVRDCAGISIALVIDASGSMNKNTRFGEVKNTIIGFLKNLKNTDRVSLVRFSNSNMVSLIKKSDFVSVDKDKNGISDIIDAVQGLTAFGASSIYDGTAKGVKSLSQEVSPKAVIVFTDGDAYDNTISIEGVISKANNDSVPVYLIGLETDPDNLKDMSGHNLKDIATRTKGRYFFAATIQQMTDIYIEIASNVRSQYKIGYKSSNASFDGTTRSVMVSSRNVSGSGIYVANSRPKIILDKKTLDLSRSSHKIDDKLTISGTVKDLNAALQDQDLSALLYYRHLNDKDYTKAAVNLTNKGDSLYSFSEEIPVSAIQKPGIEYYLYATDTIQEIYYPFNYNVVPNSISIESQAPFISHEVIVSSRENKAITISADATDPDPGDKIVGASLFYRIHDSDQEPDQAKPFIEVEMAGQDTYTAKIPAHSIVKPGMDYYIAAWDSSGIRAEHGSADESHFIKATSVAVHINLIDNGSFENPEVPYKSFRIFRNIPGWNNDFKYGLEIQNNIAGSPFNGNQFIELDAHENTEIQQKINTVAGKEYEISFAYSPRCDIEAASNEIQIFFNDILLDTITEDGTYCLDNSWSVYNYIVTAPGHLSSLKFRATGISDGFGGYLDDVRVSPIQ